MDHKRGYPYDYLEADQDVPSPTKRLKDLSHHRDFPCHRGPTGQDCHSNDNIGRANPQLGERFNAELHRSQYKTQIQFGCPQVSGLGRPQQQQQQQAPCLVPVTAGVKVDVKVPAQPILSGATMRSASSLEMKMEEVAYHSMLPLVKKELEKWAFGSKQRAPKRMPAADSTPSDDADDETTCAVCRNPRKFKGWDALLLHAQKYSKQMPWQHRGYFRALQETLVNKRVENHEHDVAAAAASDHGSGLLPTTSPGKTNDITHQVDAQRLQQRQQPKTESNGQHWRPDILIVENQEFDEVGHILKTHQQDAGKPKLREVLAVYTHGEGDDEQRHVFVFPASKVGYVGEKEIINKESKLSWQSDETFKGVNEMENRDSEQTKSSSEMVSNPTMTNDVATRCESLKEALGLQLTLDDPDDIPGKKLFDLEQIHRTSCVVNRWAESFKSATQRFEMQRVFRDSPQLVAIDKGFRADLKRIKKYSPACKRQIKDHMAQIEGQFREDHLMCLQQMEEVRVQFQELADEIHHKELHNKFYKMREELEVTKEMWKHEKDSQLKALQATQKKAILVVQHRKAKQQQERAQMMQLWMQDAKLFKQESTKAREERRRLQKIHDKVHNRAEAARKDCPVCLESFRVAICEAASS